MLVCFFDFFFFFSYNKAYILEVIYLNTNFSQENNSKIVIGEIKKKLSGFLLWITNSHFDERLTSHLQGIYSGYERELEELQKKYEIQDGKLSLFSDEKGYLVELSLFLERLTSELEGYFYYDKFPIREQERIKSVSFSQKQEEILDYLYHFLELDVKDAWWKSYFSDYIGTNLYGSIPEDFNPVELNQFYEELPEIFQQFFDKYFLLEVKRQLDTSLVLDYLKTHSILDLSFDATLLNRLRKKAANTNHERIEKPTTFSSSVWEKEKGFKRYPLTTLEQLIIEENWSEEEIRDFVKKYYDKDKVLSTPFASFNPSEDIFFDFFSLFFDDIYLKTMNSWNDYLKSDKSYSYFWDDSSYKIYFHRQKKNNQLVFGIRPILKVPEKEFDAFIDRLIRDKGYDDYLGNYYSGYDNYLGIHYSHSNFYSQYGGYNPVVKVKPSLVSYGEYPQFFSDCLNSSIMENSKLTGKTYTCFGRDSQTVFLLPEYERQDFVFQKYCLFRRRNRSYCINVSPIEWFVDYEHKLLISKYILFNGVTAMELDFRNQNVLTKEMLIQKINPLVQARLEQFAFDLVPKKYIQDSEKLNNEKVKYLKKGGFIDGKLQ